MIIVLLVWKTSAGRALFYAIFGLICIGKSPLFHGHLVSKDDFANYFFLQLHSEIAKIIRNASPDILRLKGGL